jgi:hypothetical protein
MLWKEPKAPDFVLEVTSHSTRAEDLGPKRGTYAFLGVEEYWLYDPTGDYLRLSLQGNRLVDGNYQRLPVEQGPGRLSGQSRVLGLELRVEGGEFRFVDPARGWTLPSYDESEAARVQAETARATAEAARAQAELRLGVEQRQREALEQRRAVLEQELRQLRGRS